MNRLILSFAGFFLVIVLFTSVGMGNGVNVKPIGIEDVLINGVRAKGILNDQKLKQLGSIIKINSRDAEEGKFNYYFFKDFVLQTFYEDNEKCWVMDWFEITNKDFKTIRGVSLGDDVETVIKQYGYKVIEQDVCIYKSHDGDIIVQFDFKNNKVNRIFLH